MKFHTPVYQLKRFQWAQIFVGSHLSYKNQSYHDLGHRLGFIFLAFIFTKRNESKLHFKNIAEQVTWLADLSSSLNSSGLAEQTGGNPKYKLRSSMPVTNSVAKQN